MCTIITCALPPRPNNRVSSASGMPTCSPSVSNTSNRRRFRNAYQASSTPGAAGAMQGAADATRLGERTVDVDHLGAGCGSDHAVVGTRPLPGSDLLVEIGRDRTGDREQGRAAFRHWG